MKKGRWQSEKDQGRGVPALKRELAQRLGWSDSIVRRWDIFKDWLDTRPGRITLAGAALTAAWFILQA